MKFSRFLSMCFCLLLNGLLFPQNINETYATGIQSFLEFDKLCYLRHRSITIQESSRDPNGKNNDGCCGNFRYVHNGENVMLDAEGPGVLQRIWLTGYNRKRHRLKFYFDNEPEPSINQRINNFFSGKGNFPTPITADEELSSGGFISFHPFSFKKRLIITTNGDNYYNAAYSKLDPSISIETDWKYENELNKIVELWKNCGADPKINKDYKFDSLSFNLPKKKETTIIRGTHEGGVIGQLFLFIPALDFNAKDDIIEDDGRSHSESSKFTIKINPDCNEVVLLRRADYGSANQKAAVYIDGRFAGVWYTPGYDFINRWRDLKYFLPKNLTSGKSELSIEIRYLAGKYGWTEYAYWTECDGIQIDYLDIGEKNISSEIEKQYIVSGQIWEGISKLDYPPIDDNLINNRKILNNLFLKIYWDGETEPSVEAPLGLFFGLGTMSAVKIQSLPLGVDNNNRLYCYFPMPFRNSFMISIDNKSNKNFNENILHYGIYDLNDDFNKVGYFKTEYRNLSPTVIGKDYVFLETEGTGLFLGVTQESCDFGLWHLEGDERFYIDDSKTPFIYGTGTEDYYNGAWYFNRGEFNLPAHGLSRFKGANASMYRFHISDPIPFLKNGKFCIEHGGENESESNYKSAAFYYLKSAPSLFLTDELNVGEPQNEVNHNYSFDASSKITENHFQYEGEEDNISILLKGRTHRGISSFTTNISPINKGVRLLRSFDYGILNQEADIYIDDIFVGKWRSAGNNIYKRWRDEYFIIPAYLTEGKETIRIKIDASNSESDWSEYNYKIYSIVY